MSGFDPSSTSRPGHGARRLLMLLAALALAGLLAVAGGFALFLSTIASYRQPGDRDADGIVVLTGGADRIVDATNLLVDKRGRRLLITGVHPDTTLASISRTVPASRQALECCVELGRSALNTRGNAIEAAEWTHRQGFRSLIVVTSDWHMPRALTELGRAMPEIELVPYPVISPHTAGDSWTGRLAAGRLLFVEYVKYVAASLGVRPWPAVSSEVPN